tara:strand:- start:2074 stop:2880 length:807 start_codon:yes stop_codon:yes gene_type:complete
MANSWDFGPGHTNNGSVGLGGGINGVTQGIYSESSTQLAPLGTKLEFDDGRMFRYTKSAAAITIGLVCGNDYSDGLLAETDNFTVSGSAGDREFSMTGGGSEFSTTAEAYAGSYIVFTDGTGAGQYFRIKDHTTASSDKITFQLYDKLVTAPGSDTDIIIVGNPYGAVLAADGTSVGAATDSFAVGVNPIAISSGYYFWMQTRGICSVKADYDTTAAPHYGMELIVSDAHDGQVEAKLDAHDGYQTVGYHVSPTGDDNTYISAFLTLE